MGFSARGAGLVDHGFPSTNRIAKMFKEMFLRMGLHSTYYLSGTFTRSSFVFEHSSGP
jgi:hypothetical protein